MRRFAIAASCAISLCVGAPAHGQSFLDSLKGAISGEEKKEHDSTLLDQLTESEETRDSCGGDGRASRMNAYVEQGLGIVANDEISAYLQRLPVLPV